MDCRRSRFPSRHSDAENRIKEDRLLGPEDMQMYYRASWWSGCAASMGRGSIIIT
jgi:hypothetical protein